MESRLQSRAEGPVRQLWLSNLIKNLGFWRFEHDAASPAYFRLKLASRAERPDPRYDQSQLAER